MHPILALLLAVIWTIGVMVSLWTQRNLLDSSIEALARNDAMANLKKDMAIRKWAASVGGIWIDEARIGDSRKLADQERLTTLPQVKQPAKLVLLTPIHILMGIQQTHEQEYGVKERLTSLQLRNIENQPDDWERNALKSLTDGASMASTVQRDSGGGHGILRLMIPMRMDEHCLECHRDTLVPVGGLRGGAAIAIDLNRYRAAQEPTWRAIQYWHGGIWLFGVLTIGGLHGALRRRGAERAAIEEERKETALAFAAMDEGAFITDASAKILWVNDAACEITGYSREELVGATTQLFKSGHHSPEFYAELWRQLITDGHWEGEIWNRRKDKSVFPEELSIRGLRDVTGRPRRFVAIISDISERKLREERISRLALHDSLTGLPNRNLLEEIAPKLLAQAEREAGGSGCAALFFDLDRFKEVNDSLGHEAGDRLLIDAASRLRGCLRNGDMLVRMGGDEFVALIGPEIGIAALAAGIAQRAIAALSTPFVIDDTSFALGVSVGIAVSPVDGTNWKELAKNADTALFVAKNGGRNRWNFFEPAMNAGELERARLRSALIGAIEARELFLVYQPQVDLASGDLAGFEALLRWRRGDEVLAPGAFLPMVEHTWIMRSIGALVVELVTEQIAAWRRLGLALPPVYINASPEDLASGEFCALLAGFCNVHGVPHELVGVEVLEAALDHARAEAEILALHEAGFRIAIDDFGTGYSSLSRLHRLPIAKLKLDRSFISRLPEDAKAVAITRAAASVARELGIVMVAEGIETEAQHRCLLELDCPLGQGWLLGRPEEADIARRRCGR